MIPQMLREIVPILMYLLFLQHYRNMTSMLFEDLPALFGPSLPKDGLKVRADYWRSVQNIYVIVLYNDVFLSLCEREFWLFLVH